MAVSSGVWAEQVPLEDAWNLKEVTANHDSPKTMKEELTRIGYLGKNPASYRSNPFAAHFELHIEQGPILEDQGQKIGVVEGTIRDLHALLWLCTNWRSRQVSRPSSGLRLQSRGGTATLAPRLSMRERMPS
jgi:hypothetical protein